MSFSRPGEPAEHGPSVQFREPVVSSTSAARNGANSSAKPGDGGTQSRDLTAAAGVLPRGAVELTSVDQKWGVLFDRKGQATKRFIEVMHSLAKFIIEKHLPEGSIVIVPEKLQSFYSFLRINGESGFHTVIFRSPSRDLHRKVSELYQDLGCSYHLVQAKPASRPQVPALTPDGFARWMTINAQAFPDEEARRLNKVVSTSPLEAKSALDGKIERLPKQLSRYLLPRKPDHQIRDLLLQAVKRHFGDSCLSRPTLVSVPGSLDRLSPRDEVLGRERSRRDSTSRGRPTSAYYGREKEDEGQTRSRNQHSPHRHDSHRGSYSQRDRQSPSQVRRRSQSKAGSRVRDVSRSGGGGRQLPPSSKTVAQHSSSRRASFAGDSTSPPVVVHGNAGPSSGAVRSYRSSYPEVHRTVDRNSDEGSRRRPASVYGPSSRISAGYLPGSALNTSLTDRDRSTGRGRGIEGGLSGVPNLRSGSSAALAAVGGAKETDSATNPPRQDSSRHDPRANIRRRIRPEDYVAGSDGGSRRTSAIVNGGAGRDVSQTWDEFLREN
ncbi:hypothetical protein CMQ_4752 [Grosmannia clavigera kw1407]|uniref:DUF7514 domain-containing protein n=1 Tax=Grosmannia clavigera (strain kw1407 / UAMH 11150) TaxID=655863 RepID=F0XTU3_GROCL|nr:uncharacterized protein CMQ_4752 [Grosmannia clavigera kw1407]EFW98900.1 hypothetical protein CMQ_4752 [Grosmannia clavigera kw1407]